MSEIQFLHKRDIPGVESRYLLEWQGEPLKGIYLIEHRLSADLGRKGFLVFLTPGVFDPVKGEYGAETIEGILQNKNIAAVYEPHFLYDGVCGLMDMDSIIGDLCKIFTKGDESILAVGLSGGSMAICTALYKLHWQGIKPNVESALLIGPHLTDYPTFFIKAVRRLINDEEMVEKVTRHAGHPYVPTNALKGKEWFLTNPFAEAIRQIPLKEKRPGFPVKVETRYFRFDTLSNEGRKRLHWYFDCPKPKKPIPGHHRGLFRVPESRQIICDFCEENSYELKALKN